jgi:hypothetical protein
VILTINEARIIAAALSRISVLAFRTASLYTQPLRLCSLLEFFPSRVARMALPKTIVTLDQESMLRTCHYPPQLLGKLNEGIAAIREDGQLDVIGAEGHGAEGKQADLFRS